MEDLYVIKGPEPFFPCCSLIKHILKYLSDWIGQFG